MADEITLTVAFKTNKNGGVDSTNVGKSNTRQFTQAGNYSAKVALNVTQAADVAVPLPAAISFPAYVVCENLDPTNYIEVSYGTGGGFAGARATRVLPGMAIPIIAHAAIYSKANIADCKATFTASEI